MTELSRLITIVVAPVAALLLTAAALRSQPVQHVPETSVFQQPAIAVQALRAQQQMLQLAIAGQREAALEQALLIAQLTPRSPAAHYNIACLQALSGQTEPALTSLQRAVDLGFRNRGQIESDPDLRSLHDAPRFTEILTQAAQPWMPDVDDRINPPAVPGPIENGIATVAEENTRWDPARNTLISHFQKAPAPRAQQPATTGKSAAEQLVQQWFLEGTAAGHHGDLYDNRDRDHSPLNLQKFPQLVKVKYGPTAQRAQADWGVQVQLMMDRPTLGNSSTAQVGSPFWRSNPRMFLFEDFQAKRAYNLYVNNHLYCYPEHNDYDPQHGDVYPANVPFCVVSQGSSGSDQPFLEALALTMAAFQPAVKQKLVQQGVLAPTLQAIFRRSQKQVTTDADYLSGTAHPMVFQAANIDALKMVHAAHGMAPDQIPPMIQLSVVEEQLGVPGRDYFHPGAGERLFDTPAAIARVYRTMAGSRRMVVDASASKDFGGLPLTFTWKLLQGDADKVSIRPLNSQGSAAEILLHWHPAYPVTGRSDLMCDRIDIGVFAHNGTSWSMPGLISSFSLRNERRRYDLDGHILFVDYGDPVISQSYVDPLIDIPKRWRDDFRYSDDGQLIGWVRKHPGQPPEQFNHDGTRILETDDLDRAVRTQPVRYVATNNGNRPPTLEQQVVDRIVTYTYTSPADRTGTATLH